MKIIIICCLFVIFTIDLIVAMNPYRVLGIQKYSTMNEIKSAYKKLARQYHPDRHQNDPNLDEVKEKMRKINEAYEMLKNKPEDVDLDSDETKEEEIPFTFEEKIKYILKATIVAWITNFLYYHILKGLYHVLDVATCIGTTSIATFMVLEKYFAHEFDKLEETAAYAIIVAIPIGTLIYLAKGKINPYYDYMSVTKFETQKKKKDKKNKEKKEKQESKEKRENTENTEKKEIQTIKETKPQEEIFA